MKEFDPSLSDNLFKLILSLSLHSKSYSLFSEFSSVKYLFEFVSIFSLLSLILLSLFLFSIHLSKLSSLDNLSISTSILISSFTISFISIFLSDISVFLR